MHAWQLGKARTRKQGLFWKILDGKHGQRLDATGGASWTRSWAPAPPSLHDLPLYIVLFFLFFYKILLL
jgi:hypothetical protein